MGWSAKQNSRLRKSGTDFSLCFLASALLFLATLCPAQTPTSNKPSLPPEAQSEAQSPAAKESTPAPTEKNAAQIELLETKVRFETNGDSRKEVHARVRINNELGARQFARLNFDFNRSFQSVEIPLVRITHPSGGIADILPSAITDNPNPAVVDYPAYHDVRVKSVRILGLAPDDLLEYRVITTTTHHPLAPDFWLDHTFDRSGVVSQEIFELDLPAKLHIELRINPESPAEASPPVAGTDDARVAYTWKRSSSAAISSTEKFEMTAPDVSLSTFKSWKQLAEKLATSVTPTEAEAVAIHQHSSEWWHGAVHGEVGEAYEFVAQKVRTVDLPLDAVGFRARRPAETLESHYGSAEDKAVLFGAILGFADIGFVFDSSENPASSVPSPSRFKYLLACGFAATQGPWLDLSSEVAPEGMIPAEFRGKPIFVIGSTIKEPLQAIPSRVPFHASQTVGARASISADGKLISNVRYALRGDNELLLRVAFHKTPKEKWKDVAQMLALSDGFRGQILNVTASDPYATKEPFTVEYEISQPKFVDWSKKTVRIPAILPLPGLPDPPTAEQLKSGKPIDLGTPLTIDLESTVEIPAGATAQAPIGTTVNRDYATFSSKYSVEGNKLHASRSYHFLSSELPASRASDLIAFLHAVQSDQTQLFTVTPAPQN